jgi:hypothetical protein
VAKWRRTLFTTDGEICVTINEFVLQGVEDEDDDVDVEATAMVYLWVCSGGGGKSLRYSFAFVVDAF